MGIDEPKGPYVSEWCTIENYQDPSLERWVLSPTEKIPIQIKRGQEYSNVFCLNHTIQINNAPYACPSWPFQIAKGSDWQVGNFSHKTFLIDSSNAGQEATSLEFKQLNDTLDEDPNWIMHLRRMEAINRHT